MPIPQTIRVYPLDLQGNVAIGISLPYNGAAGPFNSTYSTKDQIKSNIINVLLTDKSERLFNPQFGANLKRILFEGLTDETYEKAKSAISTSLNIFVPEINVQDIIIKPNEDNNTLYITIRYYFKISGNSDEITLELL
jgi:hypothetical protein